MSGEERREKIFNAIRESKEPISASSLASEYGVSRQVIVQDIALLKSTAIHHLVSPSKLLLIQCCTCPLPEQ